MALNKINCTYPDILRRAGVHQTTTALPWVGPGIRNDSVSSTGTRTTYTNTHGVILRAFEVHNREGNPRNVGIGFRWANHLWRVGRYDGTTYTDITTDAQNRTAVAIQVTGADQTGFVVLCRDQFAWVSADVTTAETDDDGGVSATPDHVIRFSNAAGTDWTTLNAATPFLDSWTTTDAVWSASAHNFVWTPHLNWGRSSGLTGLPDGFYALHFQSAQREASDVAAVITGMEIGSMWCVDSLADNGIWEEETANYYDPNGNALVAMFGAANAGNRVIATVETR